MKTILKTVCEHAFHSKENGGLNIIGIFETIYAQKFPAIHPKILFVLVIEGKPGKTFNYYPEINHESGDVIVDGGKTPVSAEIGPNGKMHIFYDIRNVKFEKEGDYTAKLHVGNLVEEIIFSVKLQPNTAIA